MGNLFSPMHLLIILLIILILFGRGKVSEFMGDFAKGIKSFKKGLEDDDKQSPPAQEILNENADKAAHPRNQEQEVSRREPE